MKNVGEFWSLPKNVAETTGLTPSDKLVFSVFWTRRNGENESWPSQSSIADNLGISRGKVNESVKKLVDLGVLRITEKGNGENSKYMIIIEAVMNLDSQAVRNPNSPPVRKTNRTSKESEQGAVRNLDTSKRTGKRTERTLITTTDVVDQKQVAEVMNAFKPINPHINFGNKTQRMAIVQMLSIHPYEKLLEIARFAVSNQGKPYAPTITTPYELRERMAALVVYAKKNNNKVIDLNV